MFDRRAFIALSAAVPLAGKLPRLDLPDLRVDAIELEDGADVKIISISPDARMIAGIKNREQICFYGSGSELPIYETISVERTSVTDPIAEIGLIDEGSILWSPDSSKVAFSLNAFLQMRDSDIFVVEIATGSITNLTDEGTGNAAESLLDADKAQVDMYPQWLDDETVLFVRHDWDVDKDIATSLMTMGLSDSEATTWAELSSPELRFVMAPARLLADGRMVFAADSSDNRIRIYAVAEGEAPQLIDTGDFIHFQLVDANETHCILRDSELFTDWLVPYDDPEAIRKVTELFEFESDEVPASYPAFGPTAGSMVIARNNENRTVIVYEDERVKDIAYLRGPEARIDQIIWVPNRVLVAGRGASWVIPHES